MDQAAEFVTILGVPPEVIVLVILGAAIGCFGTMLVFHKQLALLNFRMGELAEYLEESRRMMTQTQIDVAAVRAEREQ